MVCDSLCVVCRGLLFVVDYSLCVVVVCRLMIVVGFLLFWGFGVRCVLIVVCCCVLIVVRCVLFVVC